jgi:hypothetical protein
VKAKILNFIAFQLAWFACILGAGSGLIWVGVVTVAVSVSAHVLFATQRASWIVLLIASLIIGLIFDGAVMSLGVLSFPDHATLLTPVPLWMLFMWANFSLTLPLSLGWLRGRYVLGALFGLLGGPGAYYTGMKLNAIELSDDLVRSLIVVGLEWAIATPLLMLISVKAESLSHSRQPQERITEGALS